MSGGGFAAILPMVATGLIGAFGGWLSAFLNYRSQRRRESGEVATSTAEQVFAGDWRIIGWQEKELARLRGVEAESLQDRAELARLRSLLERWEAPKDGPSP